MNITRRLFNQLLAAASSCMALPKQLLGRGRDNVVATGAAITPSPRRSHVDICYVYNPGIDIAGTQWLTLGAIKVIKGGAVTRIETTKESIRSESVEDSSVIEFYSKKKWNDPGPIGEGWVQEDYSSISWYRIKNPALSRETIPADPWKVYVHGEERWVHFTEKRDVFTHPASEIVDALFSDWGLRRGEIVHIREWDNKQVDLKGVNEMIASKTLKERARALRALPTAWRMTSILRTPALESIRIFEHNRRDQLTRMITGTLVADRWQQETAALLGIDLKRLYMERRLAEEAWDAAHSTKESRPSYKDAQAYAKYIEEYEGQIRSRLQAFVTERYPLEVY